MNGSGSGSGNDVANVVAREITDCVEKTDRFGDDRGLDVGDQFLIDQGRGPGARARHEDDTEDDGPGPPVELFGKPGHETDRRVSPLYAILRRYVTIAKT